MQEIRGIEEERRLAYVAMTRAKEQLILSRPGKVPSGQDGFVRAEISTFWEEVPEELFASFHKVSKFPWDTNQTERVPSSENQSFSSMQGRMRRKHTPIEWAEEDGEYNTREICSVDDLREGVEVLHPTLGLGTIKTRTRTPNGVQLAILFSNRDKTIVFRPQHLTQLTDIVIR